MSRVRVLPTCSICHDDASPEDYVITLCGHIFHSPCIRQWDQSQRKQGRTTKCPTCCSTLRRVGGEKPNGPLGSRFVKLHSLTERAIGRSSSPAIPEASNPSERHIKEKRELRKVVSDQLRRLEELEALQAEATALRARLAQTENLLQQATRLNKETTSKHRTAMAAERQGRVDDRAQAANEIMRLRRQMEEIADLCRGLRSERDDFQKQLEKQTRELEDTTENMITFSTEVDKLRESRAQLEREMETLKATVRSMHQRSAVFEDKYQKAKSAMLGLQKQLDLLRSPQLDTPNQQSSSLLLKQTPGTPNRFSTRLQDKTSNVPQPSTSRKLTGKASLDSTSFSTTERRKKRSLADLEEPSASRLTMSAGPGKRITRSLAADSSFRSMPDPSSPSFNDASASIVLPSLFGAEPSKRAGLRLNRLAQKSLTGSGNSTTLPAQRSSKLVAMGPKMRNP